jgi:hypothetical protein
MKYTIFLVFNFVILVLLADQMIMILGIEGIVFVHWIVRKTERKIRIPTSFGLRKKVLIPIR